jgi:IstB-like ATP binding protein
MKTGEHPSLLSSFHKAELFLIPRQNKVRTWKEPMEPFQLNVHLVAHPVGNEVLATALLDRSLHHAEAISIQGRSYRMKDRLATGKKAAASKPETRLQERNDADTVQ